MKAARFGVLSFVALAALSACLNTDTPLQRTDGETSTLTLTPSDDTTIFFNNGDKNRGDWHTIGVDDSPRVDTLIRFEIPAFETQRVRRAVLRLYVVNRSNDGGDFYRAAADWSEDTVTWNSAPEAEAHLGSLAEVDADSWYELDVGALVSGDGPVAIRGSSGSNDGAYFASKEHQPGLAPQLVLTLEPLPPSLTLSPSSARVTVGDTAPTTFTATVVNTSEPVRWDLDGAGNISSTSGTSTDYTPPHAGGGRNAVLTATAGSASDSATIQIDDPEAPLSTTFIVSDDATAREDAADRNYGGRESLEIDGSPVKIGLLRFEISGLGSAEVASAILRLYAIDPSDAGGDFYRAAADWSEDTVTWNSAPEAEAHLGSLGTVRADRWYELDVTPLVSGDGPVAIRSSSTASNGADYASREHPGGFAPELVVTLAQEPVARLSIDPGSARVVVGNDSPVRFTATLTHSAAAIRWSLSGPGSLSATGGESTDYTPPGSGGADSATVHASAGVLNDSAVITIAAQGSSEPVRFAVGGDFGGRDNRAGTVMTDMLSRDVSAFLLVGDVSYEEIKPERAWCDWVHGYVGESFPFQLVVGNHEDDNGNDGFIRNFTSCMPDRLGSDLGPGGYGVNYAFDLGPVTVIATAPDIEVDSVAYDYEVGSEERSWLSETIRNARSEGDWVVVGMHKNCLTMGEKRCEIGDGFAQLLIDEGVDLVLQGHDHNYQRSHALIRAVSGSLPADAIADDGADGVYGRGLGTVTVIVGMVGRSLYDCSHSDPEVGYFVVHHCGEETKTTKGYLLLEASETELSGRFVSTVGEFSDGFAIR